MENDVNVELMSRERIQRSLNRIAHEIAEKNVNDRPVILFGIDERGFAVAKALADLLMPVFDQNVASIQLWLDNKENNDTLEKLGGKNIEDHFMIAVDDVIFSGKTMFTALKRISDVISLSEIHTAVLIDRGHRKFPVKAEFCGMELPTKANEHVSVNVEADEIKEVTLYSEGR